MLSYLRTKYWNPLDTKVLKNICNCVVYKHFSCKPYQYPETPPLPTDRPLFQNPFSVSGVDCLGLFISKMFIYNELMSLNLGSVY